MDMASRMERYYETPTATKKRSDRNKDLYRDMYETNDYSNIEGVATIDKGSEIDINKVKEMLKNREQYLKQQEKGITIKPIEKPKYEEEEEKNYDIREILNNAKNNRTNIDQHKSMNNTSYDIFKDLRDKRRKEMEIGTDENTLKELINTISNTSMLNSMTDKELSLDLLDDLKSNENTVSSGSESIKKLLEEAKKSESKKEEKTEIDKSFYTSSLGFKEEDFEELTDIKNHLKTNNILIKILVSILTISFLIGAVVLIFNILK